MNLQRRLSFIERALGVEKARELYEQNPAADADTERAGSVASVPTATR